MTDGTVFKTEEITKQYGMGDTLVHALRGVSLEIPKGELVVLLGPSGSGKSTFLNIIGGLDQPTSGDVHFKGEALAAMSDRELTYFRREHVGFVFQSYNLVPSLTALENVELITDIGVNPMPAKEAMRAVGLTDRLNHFPSQLSGGEQQRVAIARAIAKRPEVLLCDEPTGALDSETGILVLEALQNVNRTYGTTTIIITHNAAIADVADRVIYFADGRVSKVVKNEKPKDIHEIGW
ncbi:MAG: ABC transporter ATP-binding protein [Kordiimonadaceae bacterium]|nr:ABC transporter ATP-binding protein [Kordiimonadaceae bacterium]MBT6035316.1 ABC transporter ATP-binding protein [Kordiimonadaceae bacterium]MBT6330349.1 ABC transporter ATP-binding protein [Kordiimonadaceae bacterium]